MYIGLTRMGKDDLCEIKVVIPLVEVEEVQMSFMALNKLYYLFRYMLILICIFVRSRLECLIL